MIFVAEGAPRARNRAPGEAGQSFYRALYTKEVRTPKAKANRGKSILKKNVPTEFIQGAQ